MPNLYEFQQGLQKVANEQYLVDLLFTAIKETEKIALSLQKQQLGEGYSQQDELIGTYSKKTEQLARFNNPRKPKIFGEPYNFEDTGSFFDNMYLIFGNDTVSFWSKDPKVELLVDTYDNLLGLDETNLMNYLYNTILPILMKQIKTILKVT